MKIHIYTLDKENLVYLDKYIPEKIINNTGEKGYYTLGAVSVNDTHACLAGVAQFFVDSEKDGSSYAQLIYVYVADRYRRQTLGFRMIDKAGVVLTTADVDVFKASVPPELPDVTGGNLTGEELKSFLVKCGFITYGEKQNDLIRFTGRDYVSVSAASGRNDILRFNDIPKNSKILSVDCNALSGDNPALDRLKRHTVPGAVVMKMAFCDIHDLQGMIRFLNENGDALSCFDLAHMHKEISTIVFDMKGTISTVLLGAVRDGIVYVEHLISLPGANNRRYAQAAIHNLIRMVLTNEETPAYDRVIFDASDPGMRILAEEIVQTGLKPVDASMTK